MFLKMCIITPRKIDKLYFKINKIVFKTANVVLFLSACLSVCLSLSQTIFINFRPDDDLLDRKRLPF